MGLGEHDVTKLPHADWNVQGVEGPKYRVGPQCVVADCAHWADHGHHLWRRSFLNGDYRWVELWDGRIVQNIAALCWQHHELITLGKAQIVFDDEEFRYVEVNQHDNAQVTDVVLIPQPKSLASFSTAMQMTIDGNEIPHDDVVRQPEEEPPCPTCGKRPRRSKEDLPAGEKRNRKSWPVSVPKDEQENGADVLDVLVLECAKKLGREEHSSYKYYTLAEVMADWIVTTEKVADFGIGG